MNIASGCQHRLPAATPAQFVHPLRPEARPRSTAMCAPKQPLGAHLPYLPHAHARPVSACMPRAHPPSHCVRPLAQLLVRLAPPRARLPRSRQPSLSAPCARASSYPHAHPDTRTHVQQPAHPRTQAPASRYTCAPANQAYTPTLTQLSACRAAVREALLPATKINGLPPRAGQPLCGRTSVLKPIRPHSPSPAPVAQPAREAPLRHQYQRSARCRTPTSCNVHTASQFPHAPATRRAPDTAVI